MINKEELEFIKNYYELLKMKNVKDIGDRFISQIKFLASTGEISKTTANVAAACIVIGNDIGTISEDEFKILKEFIAIGSEIKEEKDAQKVANKLSESNIGRTRVSNSASRPVSSLPSCSSSSSSSVDACGHTVRSSSSGRC
jgi:hypothetical protein